MGEGGEGCHTSATLWTSAFHPVKAHPPAPHVRWPQDRQGQALPPSPSSPPPSPHLQHLEGWQVKGRHVALVAPPSLYSRGASTALTCPYFRVSLLSKDTLRAGSTALHGQRGGAGGGAGGGLARLRAALLRAQA